MSKEITVGSLLNAMKELFVPKAPTLEDLPKDILAFRKVQDAKRERAHDHLYVTDFAYKPCVRRLAYYFLRPDINDKARNAQVLFKMDCGTAIHTQFQNHVLGPMGILEGRWECSRCGHIEEGKKPTSPCFGKIKVLDLLEDKWVETTCKDAGMVWEFKEERIVLNYHGIRVTGRPDGKLIIINGCLLEIKTTDSERFAAIDEPKDYHVFQASVYAAKLGFADIVILYVDQNDWSNIKAYPVKADEGALKFIENTCETVSFLIEKEDPLRALPTCKKRSAWKARECGCKDICFPLKRKKKSGK